MKELLQLPTAEQSLKKIAERYQTRFPLNEIGFSEGYGPITLTDQDREAHCHIIGAPGEGKSKLLEILIRHDIEQGLGCCVVDPASDSGTAKQVLQYCVKRGYERVVIIDVKDIQQNRLIPTINPIIYGAPVTAVKAFLLDSMMAIFDQKDATLTTYINRYLGAVITALHYPIDFKDEKRRGHTLYDAKNFISRFQYEDERKQIIWKLPKDDEARAFLTDAFSSERRFANFESTIGRLATLFEHPLHLMLGSNKHPISFENLIARNYVIIVNLHRRELGPIQQRVLGTLIINLILRAQYRLFEKNKGKIRPYSLYIDEVGQYATDNLAHLLRHERHMKMRLTVAHQDLDQLGDIYSAVMGSAKNKFLFYTPSFDDRSKLSKMMYWGELKSDADSALAQLKKQHAAIKIGKMSSRFVRLHDVRKPDVTEKEVEEFKAKFVYNRQLNPFYIPMKEVEEEIKTRFARPIYAGGNPSQKAQGAAANQSTGGEPVGSKGHPDTSVDPEQSNDQHPDVQTGPMDEGGDFQLPRRRHREAGVQSTLVHKGKQNVGAVDVPRPDTKRKPAAGRKKAGTPKTAPDGGVAED